MSTLRTAWVVRLPFVARYILNRGPVTDAPTGAAPTASSPTSTVATRAALAGALRIDVIGAFVLVGGVGGGSLRRVPPLFPHRPPAPPTLSVAWSGHALTRVP